MMLNYNYYYWYENDYLFSCKPLLILFIFLQPPINTVYFLVAGYLTIKWTSIFVLSIKTYFIALYNKEKLVSSSLGVAPMDIHKTV